MAIFSNSIIPAAAAAAGDVITKSVRFNRASDPYMTFTPSSTGNQKKWTNAMWIKRSAVGISAEAYFGLTCEDHSGAHNDGVCGIYFGGGDDKLDTYFDTAAQGAPFGNINDRVYRDPAGWMQIIWAVDAANTVQRIWVNGVEETASSSMNPPDYDYAMNKSGHLMAIGASAWGIGESSFNSFDGYYAQVVHLDGQYITDPTEFGQFSETSGEWEPIEITSSSFNYGTNGALLEFLQDGTSADSSGIGADTSGNDNHWSISSIAAEDCVEDSPQSNFCTLNAISGPPRGAITFSEGNLKATGGYDVSAGYYPRIMGTMAASSGKWFYEARVNTTLASAYEIGFKGVNTTWPSASHGLDGGTTTWSTESEIGYSDYWGGIKHCNSSTPETTDAGSYGTAGTVIGLAIDLDASPQTMKVWNEGTGYDSADLPTGGSDAFYPCIDLQSTTSGSLTVNFGQDATFAGTESGTTYTTDASGGDTGGEFTMQPPAGYKAWTTKNLPEPTIAKPSEHFDIKTWTATSTNPKVLDFPWSFATDGGLVWQKMRNTNGSHYLFDTVRGDNKGLYSNNSEIEEALDHSDYYTQDFDGSGDYSIQQDSVGNEVNYSGNTYVAWGWKAGTSFDAGDGSGTGLKNVDAGFSIAKWEGDDSSFGMGTPTTQEVSHGLTVTPEMIIAKERDLGSGTGDWAVWHKDLASGKYLTLNSNVGEDSWSDPLFSNIGATSVDVGSDPNGSGIGMNDAMGPNNYIAYFFASVESYSMVGSFKGNGLADGPLAYCGFKPAFIMIKNSGGSYWAMFDTARSPRNSASTSMLYADLSNAQDDYETYMAFDILSNGFKIRHSISQFNGSGADYIFYAVAESPFKYANAR